MGYFEKMADPSQARDHITPGNKAFLSLLLSNPHSHVGLAAPRVGFEGLSCNMKQKLWTPPLFCLALMKARSDFVPGGTDGGGTLETQGPPLLFPQA